MEGDGFLAGTEAAAAQTLLRDAAMTFAVRTNAPRDFLTATFERVVPEDLLRYSVKELAALATESYSFMQTREPATAKIRVRNPAGAEPGRLQSVTVIEIINDDMPFLVDSVMGELTERSIPVHLIAHPIFTVERDGSGRLVAWNGNGKPSPTQIRESHIQVHVDRLDEVEQEKVRAALANVLGEVRLAVSDWKAMLERLRAAIEVMRVTPPPLPREEIAEALAFLEWLAADNFTFLGYREYAYQRTEDAEVISPLPETGLGILRNRDVHVLRRAGQPVTTTPELHEFIHRPVPLIITKANVRSRIHRRVHMDYVGIKRFENGRVVGEARIVGLFTSTAYTQAPRSIPYLRRKVAKVLARAGFEPSSHSGKALVNVLETYPRDELFQIDDERLFQFAMDILRLDEHPRVRVLARRDRFERFVSVLVYVPRDRYHSAVRERIGQFLAEAFNGRVSAYYPYFPDGPLVRVHFIIGRDQDPTPNPDRAALEATVERLVRDWTDGLAAALYAAHEPSKARRLLAQYRDAFSAGYQEAFTPEGAVEDIRVVESLTAEAPIATKFYARAGAEPNRIQLKILSHSRPMPLSERVPVLENMGFTVINERTYRIEPGGEERRRAWLHDMTLSPDDGRTVDIGAHAARLEAGLMAVIRGRAENDGYNALILKAELPWRDVSLIRALSRYLRQVGVPYSQDYLWSTLVRHAPITAKIVALFHGRFDPRLAIDPNERAAREQALAAEIEESLAEVQSLDEDRILRRFVNLVAAAVRTSYYRIGADSQPKETISIKYESRKVLEMPAPRPLFEIFVYSPRVEGIHLRFGKVARGGIRWSDRPQDFRTEVLGLVKAQQVKNAVIVPVGAKGGFVPKRLPAGGPREAMLAEAAAAYDSFISSLLEITDNVGPDGIIPPANVVRHDGDDPYLVVAADKGTATFSDRANEIAIRHEFWLGDAFASGGSAGYDHKKMGITARGAWEAVKRHFREMNIDIRETPFTVAGVGDMSGDVFGNGMLLERTIKLVAAFDHRDIFIDPDPDPELSWAERKRLFELPRSSWQDYDKSLISTGGGVFSRRAKKIVLSEEARTLLGLDGEEATPAQVMHAILKLPVDLLWFGGIGTFVRSSRETNDEVGDRANDAIRVAASELRCRVIGEGANLGVTQRGRIEAARCGVRLNTDAIDNSAGVNSSDVEVNIKIGLSTAVRGGRLSMPARNALLVEMTEDVAKIVLRNNYLQTLAISLAEQRGVEDLGFEQRLMQSLEARGVLDRGIEFLPSDAELGERRARGQGLTRPEIAVLLAYAKITLFDDLLESDVPDDPYLSRELMRYFPGAAVERFPDAIETHRLRREIIATMLANSMINRGGPSFVARISDQTGAEAAAIAKAFAAVRDSYGMIELNGAIDALDGLVNGEFQLALYRDVQDLLLDRVAWFLRHGDLKRGLSRVVGHYRSGIEAVAACLDGSMSATRKAARAEQVAELTAAGVPAEIARKLASLRELADAPDIVLIAERSGTAVERATETFFAAGEFFQIDRIVAAARSIAVSDHFERLALDRALGEIAASVRELTARALAGGASGMDAVSGWAEERQKSVKHVRKSIREIIASDLTLAKLMVAVSLLADLVES